MVENIEVLVHSSIRINGEKVIYIDPFMIEEEQHNADIILITHNHHDHFSPEDIQKIQKEDTIYVVPEKMNKDIEKLNLSDENILFVKSNQEFEVKNIKMETIPAYNTIKPFHPKHNGWVGYVITLQNERIYIAGDTDINEDNKKVKCDIALVPIGGTFTMNAQKAAEFVNMIKPKIAIPMHYGSIVGKKEMATEFKDKVDADIQVVMKLR